MSRINMNLLAKAVTLDEGKKHSLNIGDVKEVIHLTLKNISMHTDDEILSLMQKFRKEEK